MPQLFTSSRQFFVLFTLIVGTVLFIDRLAAAESLGGKWVDAEGREALETDVISAVRSADYVLLGEVHDNPAHHQTQARLLAALLKEGRRPALVWEMAKRDQAPALATAKSADEFAAALDWESSGWPDFRVYRPLAELAYRYELPMVAGNLPTALLRQVSREGLGALPPPDQNAWGISTDPGKALRNIQLDAVFTGHCELVARQHLGPMVDVQIARDGSLAGAMVSNRTADGAVLIAGTGHVDKAVGVPFYLNRLDPKAKILAIGQTETATGGLGQNEDQLAYDYLYITRPVDRPDPCDQMRAFMKQKAKSN